MDSQASFSFLTRLFGPGPNGDRGALWPRWIFLRALGLIFFSVFYSLAFQIKGLIGLNGLLPAGVYLELVRHAMPGLSRYWYAPTLLWLGNGNGALMALVWGGLIASVLLTLNVWPRGMIAVCLALFLSFIGAAQDFSSYQSDGMLLEAAFLCLFFAPRGFRPGLGADQPPSRVSLFLLRWEWFRIYFESGVVKLASGDPQWRDLTAMNHYYENGPLPSWIGWYVQQRLPQSFHAGTALATLIVELVLVWLAWLPRPLRLACFTICTLLQVGIIATANYAFLNYLVFALGFLLLDDKIFTRFGLRVSEPGILRPVTRWRMVAAAGVAVWIFYATLVPWIAGHNPVLAAPARALEPFRIANQYGLFAVMTRERDEIEFQGSRDGVTWIAYPFRYKPQDLKEAPGVYAPYQPRFEWNLWFASLGPLSQSSWVETAEVRLLEGSRDVLALFRRDPFAGAPPPLVRAVLWQYGFTTPAEKRRTGNWWWRKDLGLYAPVMERKADGSIAMR
ncbi:MAG TPA: lipase maturation factor family protein [Thermoanaerobaculia bacterium]|nr:lipase maturation factor family protein [Thermoanaerobaculia bacterium]